LPARSRPQNPDSMFSASSLIVDLVREGFTNGQLWNLPAGAQPVWAGRGTFKPCVVCRVKIAPYEKQYDVAGPRGAMPTHMTCYLIWVTQSERARKLAQSDDNTRQAI
jgi:hypothetical protein